MRTRVTKKTWHSAYGIAPDLTLSHENDECGMLWLSPSQAARVRREIGDSGDSYVGMVMPRDRGEGCWQAND